MPLLFSWFDWFMYALMMLVLTAHYVVPADWQPMALQIRVWFAPVQLLWLFKVIRQSAERGPYSDHADHFSLSR